MACRAAALPNKAARRRPRGALVLIGHTYLISGLSDMDRRARGKETEEPNEGPKLRPSLVLHRGSAPGETSQVLRSVATLRPTLPLCGRSESADRSREDSCFVLGMRESSAPPAVLLLLVLSRCLGLRADLPALVRKRA
jgi:hypothetical protein